MVDYSKPPKINQALLQEASRIAKRVTEYFKNKSQTPLPEQPNWKKEGF